MKYIFLYCIVFIACHFSLAQASAESKYVDYFSKNKKKSIPNVNYGQLFIEENRRINPATVELVALGGSSIGRANINAWFYGGELRYRMVSHFYIGLDFVWYHSQLPENIREMLPDLATEGTKVETAGLRNWSLHINGHLNFFTSHVNLAGVARINMSVPIQLGVGITHIRHVSAKNTGLEDINIQGEKVFPSFQWGVGPRVQFGKHFSIQVLLSHVHLLKEPWFRFPQLHGSVVFGF